MLSALQIMVVLFIYFILIFIFLKFLYPGSASTPQNILIVYCRNGPGALRSCAAMAIGVIDVFINYLLENALIIH